MYKRQQQNELNIPPELQEQIKFPIFNIVYGLNQGRTQKVAIKTLDGFFVSAVNGGGGLVLANSTSIGPNETFLLIPQGLNREKVAIRTTNGYFLGAVDGGGGFVDAKSTTIGSYEQFFLIPVNPDKANFISSKRFFLLALSTEPRFIKAYGLGADARTTFVIIPQS